MSSFVICKDEYVKAAGLICGIEESKRHSSRYFMQRVYNRFVEVYEMNVASVNEQYGDNDAPDEEEYLGVFERYKKIGEKIWLGDDENKKTELRASLVKFFMSSEYQIENEEMNEKARAWFYVCTAKMLAEDVDEVEGWWGRVEI